MTTMGYAFLLLLLAASAIVYSGLSAITKQSTSSLRQREAQAFSSIVSNAERKLQNASTLASAFSDDFVIPFRLVWNMKFSNDTILVEPSEEEYNGLFYATLHWLLASANEVYSNETSFQVQSFDMTFFGASFNASDPFASTVVMEIQCHLQANNASDIPPLIDFLVTISGKYNRTVFLEDYLKLEDSMLQPDAGIFKKVEDLRYNIVPSALPVLVGTAPEEDMEISILSMTMEFQFDIGFGIPDREPTPEEYTGFMEATSQWLRDVLGREYPGTNDTQPNNTQPTFHSLSSSIEAIDYDPPANLPHTIQIRMDISFQVPSLDTVKLPTSGDILGMLRAQDWEDYKESYIQAAQPELGLFTGILALSWQYLQTGYSFGVSRSNETP
jgi:hypothetical protein